MSLVNEVGRVAHLQCEFPRCHTILFAMAIDYTDDILHLNRLYTRAKRYHWVVIPYKDVVWTICPMHKDPNGQNLITWIHHELE